MDVPRREHDACKEDHEEAGREEDDDEEEGREEGARSSDHRASLRSAAAASGRPLLFRDRRISSECRSPPPRSTAVVRELAPLVGSRVDAVRVHAERALTLELFGRAGPALLLLSAEPDVTRLHAAAHGPPQPELPVRLPGAAAPRARGRAGRGDRVAARRSRRAARARHRRAARLRLVARADRPPRQPLPGRSRRDHPRERGAEPLRSAATLVAGRALRPPRRRAQAPSPREQPRFAPDAAGARFPLSAAIEARYRARSRRSGASPRGAAGCASRSAPASPARRARSRSSRRRRRACPPPRRDRRAADLLKANLRRGEARRARGDAHRVDGGGAARGGGRARSRAHAAGQHGAVLPALPADRGQRRARRGAHGRGAGREAALRGAPRRDRRARGSRSSPRLEREARRLGAAPRPALRARRGAQARRAGAAVPDVPLRVAALAILVGRGAAENDRSRCASRAGNDLWLHARGVAGRARRGAAREGAGARPGDAPRRGAPRGALLRRARRSRRRTSRTRGRSTSESRRAPPPGAVDVQPGEGARCCASSAHADRAAARPRRASGTQACPA